MKMIMKSVEAQGYNKEKALESTGLDVELKKLKNATQAWKKAGSPLSTKELNKFMEKYTEKLVGAYIVVDPASDDTRTRPYNVINEVTKGKRKSTTTYQIKEASLKVKVSTSKNEEGEDVEVTSVSVLEAGAVEATALKKDLAFKKVKELIEENKKDYVVEIVKEITEGQKYAGYGLYTPSKSAKLGKFVFFVAE
jgi:hypothetical protein